MLTGAGLVTLYSAAVLGRVAPRLGLARSLVRGALGWAAGLLLLPLLRAVDGYAAWPQPLLVAVPDTILGVGFLLALAPCSELPNQK